MPVSLKEEVLLRNKRVTILSGNLFTNILLYSLPIIASGMLQLLFNVVGLMFAGRFSGDSAVAAIGATSQIINLLVNFIIGLSVGASVTLSKYFGAKDHENIHRTVHTAMLVSIVGGIVLMVLGIVFSKQILLAMDTPAEIVSLSDRYIKMIYIGLPALMIYNFGAGLICATGDSKRPLYFLSLAGVLNIVLNYIFVALLPCGVMGVGLATILSQYLSAVLVVSYLRKADGALRFDYQQMKLYPNILRMMMMVGLPAGFQSVIFSISNLVIQSSINSFGMLVVAGNTAANSIENFVYRAMNAIYQAMMTFYGQNLGAKHYDRLHQILLNCIVIVFFIGLVLGQGAYLFGDQLLRMFTSDPDIISYGLIRLSLIGSLYFLYGILEVFIGGLRVLGYSIISTLIAFFGVCVLRIAWIYTIFKEHPTLQNLFLSFPVSWTITCIVIIACYIIVSHSVLKKLKSDAHNAIADGAQ